MHAEKAFFFLFYKNDNMHLAVVASTAFDLFSRMQWTRRMKKEKAMQTKWEAQWPAHISSLLTGLRLTPGILIKVYVQVSVRVAFLKKWKKLASLWLAFRILWHVLLKFSFLQILVPISVAEVHKAKLNSSLLSG